LADVPSFQPLSGQLVVFAGKLGSLGRKDARALVARLGGATADELSPKTTMLVAGEERSNAASRDRNQKLQRAAELNADSPARIRVLSEAEFCTLAGIPSLDDLKRHHQATRDLLARYRLLREDHLRYLTKCGVIRPVLRTSADVFYSFADVAAIKQVNDEMADGASFHAVARALVASTHGQLAFDFRLDVEPARVLTLPRPVARPNIVESSRDEARSAALAEEYFRTGSQLDDGDESTEEDAAAAYREALAHNPALVPALINLANIHYNRDELPEAQVLYERAIALESGFFEAHFNLGNIYHDLGRFPEAQASYRQALRLNPLYADAHFYLAVTFEKMGQSREARPHWRSYQNLAPNGEWVELAREFSR
jgi:tetratricopeptide (TPR) repeat protein